MDVWICLDYDVRPDDPEDFHVDAEIIGVFLEEYKATITSINTKCDVKQAHIDIVDDYEREILKCAM